MAKSIKITGRDIIELDGIDHTGALKELGVKRVPKSIGGCYDSEIAEMKFCVDLDFVLRHGLLDERIYEKHYKKSEEYRKYYNEGRDAFLAGKEEDPPYDTGTTADPDYWTNSIYHKRYPWYDGYRATEAATHETKYKITAFQKEIAEVVARYGFTIDYTDEYCTPFCKTPDGYTVEFAP